MAQPQHQIQMPAPSPAFSPPQMSPPIPSAAPAAAAYAAAANHPSKRQKMSPGPSHSQPASPSPYLPAASFAHSPAAGLSTPTPPASASALSPTVAQHSTTLAPQPRAVAATSPPGGPQMHLNGSSPNGLSPSTLQATGLIMPSRNAGTPPIASPALAGPPPAPPIVSAAMLTPAPMNSPYATTSAMLAPLPTTPALPGTMGPPSKPADRPAKDVQYEWDDTLAGTGIDMREEEQFLASFYAGTTRPEARTGFPANTPGGSAFMYGAGLANQPAVPTSLDQTHFAAELAKSTWADAATKLASVRSSEVHNPFVRIATLHRKVNDIAKENGIAVILDPKSLGMGKMRMDTEFSRPTVKFDTQTSADGTAMSTTTSSWLPNDSFLVEQIALLSIATKHRVRELLEDAHRVASHRQSTSHGEIPPEWADAAIPIQTLDASLLSEQVSPGPGNESAVSPHPNPLKRPHGDTTTTPPSGSSTSTGINLTAVMREGSKTERDAEEARLRKRQKRAEEEERKKKGGTGGSEASAAPSRAGSVAPVTPGPGGGSVAPEPESQQARPTKKELKAKAAAARTTEAQATANSNQTMNLMFNLGKKKKAKQYSWMTSTPGGSGASTPQRVGSGLGGGLGMPGGGGAGAALATAGGGVGKAPGPVNLTVDGRYRLGELRESGERGKNIQLRDWVSVLEMDGREVRVLQQAYDKLDLASK